MAANNHVWKKTTFKSPTWCSHCDQFLWGLVQQGYRCKGCKYVVAKKCYKQQFDQLPATCNPSTGSSSLEPTTLPELEIHYTPDGAPVYIADVQLASDQSAEQSASASSVAAPPRTDPPSSDDPPPHIADLANTGLRFSTLMPQLESALGASQDVSAPTAAAAAGSAASAVAESQVTDPSQEYVSLGTIDSIIEKLQLLWNQNEAENNQERMRRLEDMIARLTALKAAADPNSTEPIEVRVPIQRAAGAAVHVDEDLDDLLYLSDSDEEIDIPGDAPEVECPVCWDDVKEPLMKDAGCGTHKYCKNCLKSHFATLIMDGRVNELSCPNPECDHVPCDEIIRRVCGLELYSKYQEFAVLVNLRKNPNARWCPRKDCSAVQVIEDPSTLVDNKVTCHKCKTEYCFLCRKPFHPKVSCDDADGDPASDEESFAMYLKEQGAKVKPCPRCGNGVEKNKGCNHMTCATCQHGWCWLCLDPCSGGDHYKAGRCKGMWFTNADTHEEAVVMARLLKEHRRKTRGRRYVRNVAIGIVAAPVVVVGAAVVVTGVVVLAVLSVPIGIMRAIVS
eukprot:CAMPEP_0177679986 /NCGR_PEP_ID=MMETSP0447-20121125/29921_1 /TAXON_ID=0 /ORGANISM="Stygamoeba regulata, Strain BSH-02190019" /LENGTH=562 /DNA_ID=CAMNT_0019189265 /DNA_START=21 /DNA_END=1709 /DNA_ORIENTATION=+